ncbi:hypothetical protein HZS_2785 [Henneguya salminicola]|nr:hypothetical protein HZS_2785 [Henneguya salminicola]
MLAPPAYIWALIYMSLPDWIHCNHCFKENTFGCVFFLTSCGHILCQNCVDSTCNFTPIISAHTLCKLCSNRGNVVEINSNLMRYR